MGLLYCCTCLRSPLPQPPWQQVHQPAAALRSPQQLFIEGNSQLCRDGNGKVFPLCSSAPAPGKHEAAWWFPLLLVAAAPPPAPARQRGHTPLSSSRLGTRTRHRCQQGSAALRRCTEAARGLWCRSSFSQRKGWEGAVGCRAATMAAASLGTPAALQHRGTAARSETTSLFPLGHLQQSLAAPAVPRLGPLCCAAQVSRLSLQRASPGARG